MERFQRTWTAVELIEVMARSWGYVRPHGMAASQVVSDTLAKSTLDPGALALGLAIVDALSRTRKEITKLAEAAENLAALTPIGHQLAALTTTIRDQLGAINATLAKSTPEAIEAARIKRAEKTKAKAEAAQKAAESARALALRANRQQLWDDWTNDYLDPAVDRLVGDRMQFPGLAWSAFVKRIQVSSPDMSGWVNGRGTLADWSDYDVEAVYRQWAATLELPEKIAGPKTVRTRAYNTWFLKRAAEQAEQAETEAKADQA